MSDDFISRIEERGAGGKEILHAVQDSAISGGLPDCERLSSAQIGGCNEGSYGSGSDAIERFHGDTRNTRGTCAGVAGTVARGLDFTSSYIVAQVDIVRACKFATDITSAGAQSTNDFGRPDLPRDIVRCQTHTAMGKLSEIVFCEFAEQFGLYARPDMEIYQGVDTTDLGSDVSICAVDGVDMISRARIDIKAIASYSKWLLVDAFKFTPGAYVAMAIDLPHGTVTRLYGIDSDAVVCKVLGFAYHYDLINPATHIPHYQFKAGEFLTDEHGKPIGGTNMRGGKNYGLPVSWLRNSSEEWQSLFDWTIQSCAPL